MKILSIIGTRPQYVKIKPLYDFFKEKGVEHIIIDTGQHYTPNVSSVFIKEFDLKIDYIFSIDHESNISFQSITEAITEIGPSVVLVVGDTNSALAGAKTAKEMGKLVAHLEAGIRCGDRSRPEEMNRELIDELSDIHFISRKKDAGNVENPICVGDIEYKFLNDLENEGRISSIDYNGPILMTIHRAENTNEYRLKVIFDFCEKTCRQIIFPFHHRAKQVVEKNNIKIPSNIEVIDPVSYFEMIKLLATCKGIISDSGGITKVAPYFGKKIIIPLDAVEWDDVMEKGYGINYLDCSWFDDYKIKRDRDFYYIPKICDIILTELKRYS